MSEPTIKMSLSVDTENLQPNRADLYMNGKHIISGDVEIVESVARNIGAGCESAGVTWQAVYRS